MLRKQLRRLIPSYAAFPLMMTGVMNFIAFQFPKFFQLFLDPAKMHDMTTAFDAATPFLPVWVYMYVATFAFWTYQNVTVAREAPQAACRLFAADATMKIVCFLCFVIFPTTNVRPEVTGSGFTAWLMRFIYWIDTPTNLFPSIHCCVAWLGTRLMFDCKTLKHKTPICIACIFGSVMVFLSTLFTKQHVVWDVLSGIAVAELGYGVARYSRLPALLGRLNERFMATRLGKFLCD